MSTTIVTVLSIICVPYYSGTNVRNVDSAIYQIVMFQLPQKGIKSNDTMLSELA